MKWGAPEYKRVRMTSIRCDVADIRRRMKEPHVKELAADIAARGDAPIHAPTVRANALTLICGRDRLAALMVNKVKTTWVHAVECTDQEAAEMERAENLYRRPYDAAARSKLLAELVALKEQQIRGAAIGDSVPDRDDASKSDKQVKVEARRAVARAAGITPGAVKKAEQRAAAAAEQDSASPSGPLAPGGSKHAPDVAENPAPIALPPGFNAFELDVPEASRSVIDTTAKWLGEWAQDISNVLRELTEMEKRGPYAVASAQLQKIRDALQGAGHAIRDAIPASLCWYCKAQPAVTPTCHPCGQTGVAGRHGGDNVPPEAQLAGANARCAVNGEWVLVSEALGEVVAGMEKVQVMSLAGTPMTVTKKFADAVAARAAAAKPAKRIKVTGLNGEDIPLPEDESQVSPDDGEEAF